MPKNTYKYHYHNRTQPLPKSFGGDCALLAISALTDTPYKLVYKIARRLPSLAPESWWSDKRLKQKTFDKRGGVDMSDIGQIMRQCGYTRKKKNYNWPILSDISRKYVRKGYGDPATLRNRHMKAENWAFREHLGDSRCLIINGSPHSCHAFAWIGGNVYDHTDPLTDSQEILLINKIIPRLDKNGNMIYGKIYKELTQ